jgi:hypothetical protein
VLCCQKLGVSFALILRTKRFQGKPMLYIGRSASVAEHAKSIGDSAMDSRIKPAMHSIGVKHVSPIWPINE